jgi:hypothetical protein
MIYYSSERCAGESNRCFWDNLCPLCCIYIAPIVMGGAYLTELQKQCLFDKEDLKVI